MESNIQLFHGRIVPSIPIWRGTPWMNIKKGDEITDPTKVYEDALSRSPRLQAVAWSYDHPDLLDAKIGKLQWLRRHPYWEKRDRQWNGKAISGRLFHRP